jgi:hypothetical protein
VRAEGFGGMRFALPPYALLWGTRLKLFEMTVVSIVVDKFYVTVITEKLQLLTDLCLYIIITREHLLKLAFVQVDICQGKFTFGEHIHAPPNLTLPTSPSPHPDLRLAAKWSPSCPK